MAALSYDDLQRTIKAKGAALPAYYLHGEEDLLKDQAIRSLINSAIDPATRDFNVDRRRAGEVSAEEFQALALTSPMLAERRAVVVFEVEDLQQKRSRMQALRAAVLSYLEKPAGQTLLILVQSAGERPDADLARRTASVNCARLSPDKAAEWVRDRAAAQGLSLDASAVRMLLEVAGEDLPSLAAEVSKLASAVTGRAVTSADVEELAGVRHGETVADFVAAVMGRRFADAANMVGVLLSSPGASGVKLVTALGSSLSGLLLARSLLDSGMAAPAAEGRVLAALQFARPAGLGDWRAAAAQWVRDAQGWSAGELEQAASQLLRADKRLKASGLAGEEEVVREAVLSLGAARVAA